MARPANRPKLSGNVCVLTSILFNLDITRILFLRLQKLYANKAQSVDVKRKEKKDKLGEKRTVSLAK